MTEASRVQKLLTEQNDEINHLRNRNKKLESALHQWDHLIAHQFTGSRAAMSAMHDAAQITAALLHGEAPWPETRIEKLEAALRRIKEMHHDGGVNDLRERDDRTYCVVYEALEGKIYNSLDAE
jgi:hypothetical protein